MFSLTHSNAFYELKKYQTAKATLEVGSSLAPADAKTTDLIKSCDEHIAGTRPAQSL